MPVLAPGWARIALVGGPKSTVTMTVPPSPSPSHPSNGNSTTGASILILVACIALFGVLITTLFQWLIGKRTIRVNSETATGVAERAKADALAKRYQDAAQQLGHDKAPVRLAGVYAMALLANDWPDQRQTCVDVLCAYLRMPFQSLSDAIPDPSDNTARPSPDEHSAGQQNNMRYESGDRQELQVRLTVQRVLEYHLTFPEGLPDLRRLGWPSHLVAARERASPARRRWRFHPWPNAPVPENNSVGLSETPWQRIRIDLEGAVLKDFRFNQCHAFNVNFHGAQFIGDAQFSGAQFTGFTTFGGAQFSGNANFDNAQFIGNPEFVGAEFDEAKLEAELDEAELDEAELDKVKFNAAEFDEAKFDGEASFDGAQFIGNAKFGGAKFHGEASFDAAHFIEDAKFGGAKFGGRASFFNAKFYGEAEFGEDAEFGRAEFRGVALFLSAKFYGEAKFEGAQFTGAGAFFDEAQFRGVWFGGDRLFKGFRIRPGSSEDDFPDGTQYSEGALFVGETSFAKARFIGTAWFGGVGFVGRALFGGAEFSEVPGFRGARANYTLQHVWPRGWRLEPPSSSSSSFGRLISDSTTPTPTRLAAICTVSDAKYPCAGCRRRGHWDGEYCPLCKGSIILSARKATLAKR
jgi:uncharacterized protein YjbI with pentapeptide repeats